ncbi:hypothetical protein [Pseudomonas solani]|uniref:hypothetical protein n=1 Tax=Pseudomonas solani TaxID=2731552 RepID=UPI003D6AAC3C
MLSYMALCESPGGKPEMCKMYLAGYRAALYGLYQQTRDVQKVAVRKCKEKPGSIPCSVDPSVFAMRMFEGCNFEAANLASDDIQKKLREYTKGHPESLDEDFTVVYQQAIGESYPCKGLSD